MPRLVSPSQRRFPSLRVDSRIQFGRVPQVRFFTWVLGSSSSGAVTPVYPEPRRDCALGFGCPRFDFLPGSWVPLLAVFFAADAFSFTFPARHPISSFRLPGAKSKGPERRNLFFRRPGLQPRRTAPGANGLQPLKNCSPLFVSQLLRCGVFYRHTRPSHHPIA